MRVCFISEAQSVHTQRWTKGLVQAGCEIHLITSSNVKISGVELHHLPIYSANPFIQIRNIIRIRRLIYKLKPDVIHLFGLFAVNSLGSMWLIKSWPRLVISVWGSDVVPLNMKESIKEKFIKSYLLRKGKHIVAISQYLADEVSKYVNESQIISIIPWGIDFDQFMPSVNSNKKNSIILGFAKRIEMISGADILFKVFKLIIERTDRDVHLKIAGAGAMKPSLSDFAMEHGFDQRVEWLGWLSDRRQVVDFYRSIDIFVMPSRRESFGVAALEAAASGLPVIASRFGGIPEIVLHNWLGQFVSGVQSDIRENRISAWRR